MHKVLKLILLLFFSCGAIFLKAQNKYAVLVAVNDYYSVQGTKGPNSLRGCINDANSMKDLLQNRFGFAESNIYSLYNERVTKKNFIDLMMKTLSNCKSGDAVVFYYSGHGVWITNWYNNDDLEKQGRSQAIVMSDLYSPGWNCLVFDETLKRIFNEFVNKRVTLTTIFDCCFSANLAKSGAPPDRIYWTGNYVPEQKKDIDIEDIPYIPVIKEPAGCHIDDKGHVLDTLDTDKDGIPDCKDWEIHTPAGHRVNYGGIDMEAPEIDLTSQDPYMDSVVASAHGVDTRSYNMSDAIHLQYKATELRPANRPDSKFLSISGTSDIKPGLEISDENKLRHGAFTKSLLMVYKENPPSLKISSLLQKVDNLMKTQGYYQGMGSTCDKSRMEGNLTGLPPLNFTAKPTATIIRNMGSQVVLNRGSNANLCRGNIFSVQTGSPAKIQVVKVFSDSSIARVLSGSIKAGNSVTLIDNYTITEPLVNLYISKPRYSPTAFDIFFSSSVMPMVQLPQYRDYNNWKNREEALEVYLNEPGSNMEYAEKIKRENFPFYVFLPMPSTIYDAIKKQLSYNQNLRLVDKEEKADFVMYVNYIKEQPDTKSGFSFYFHPRMANKKAYGDRIFSEEHETVSTMPNTHLAAELLAKKIAILGAEMVRIVSNDWQNNSPKR